MTVTPENLTIQDIEYYTQLPRDKWHGNCPTTSNAAHEMLLANPANPHFRRVYGHYTGDVCDDGYWAHRSGLPFQAHWWLISEDGTIVDVSRWSFLNREPSVAIIKPDDPRYAEYDEGGNSFRQVLRTRVSPPPKAELEDKLQALSLKKTEVVEVVLQALIPEAPVTVDRALNLVVLTTAQMFWISGVNYNAAPEAIARLYAIFENAGRGALIPIDNMRRAKFEYPHFFKDGQ